MNNFDKQAVISYSGGMDSTCLMMHLLSKGYKINAYSFDYGQAHSVELKKARKNVKYLQKLGLPVEHQIINLRDVFSGDTSTLVKHEKSPEGDYREETMKSTVVCNRNVIFSSVIFAKALSLAKTIEQNVLISLGVHAGDHCFTGDTYILTPNGMKTVETLKIGDNIFSVDPENQTIHLDKCIDIIQKGQNNEIYNIRTTSGKIRLTSEHEVYVCDFNDYNKSKGYVKSISKKKAKDLKIGDFMITSYKTPNLPDEGIDEINIYNIFNDIDHHDTFEDGEYFGFYRDNGGMTKTYLKKMPAKEFVRLMAWYISEGCTSIPSKPGVSKYLSSFSQSMYKNLENCESIFEDLKKLQIPINLTESKIIECGRPKEVAYSFSSVISVFMKSCGCNSREKHIPDWLKSILYRSRDLRTEFIHTLCLGDGHYDEISHIWSYQSNSEQLIRDVAELVKLSDLYVKVNKPNQKAKTISISFGLKNSKTGLVRIGDMAITEIKEIDIDTSKTEKVYDISVEKNHNFFAGSLGNVLISNSIYPDCREESVNMARELFRISNWDSELVEYDAPFVNIDKAEVLKSGIVAMKELGLTKRQQNTILKNTVSCYNATPDGKSCGKCGTCTERLSSFKMNGLKDPAPYVK